MNLIKILIILTVNIISKTEAARILAVFPTPSISHQVAFRPLIHELARLGHDVTVITPDPAFPKDKSPDNLTEIDVHDLSYNAFKGLLEKHQGVKEDFVRQIKDIFENIATIFERQMQVPESKKLFGQKFDLIILEAYVRPALGLSHVFKVPVIQISSLGTGPSVYSTFGAPSHLLLYPSPIAQRLYNLTLFEKAEELLRYHIIEYVVSTTEEFDYQVMRRTFGNDVPKYKVLEKNVQMLFLNEHPIWAGNHPVPPNIVYIGGIHQTPVRELPEEFKTILDSSKNGVIYVSFGTNVKPSFLPPEKIAVMTNVLSQLPYDVLWKWDSDTLPGKSTNIKISKWFPQSDILKHPKIKLFITQGGIQSADEAINAAVPIIGIPMLSDQWYNVEKYVHHGVGLQLDIHKITEEVFGNAVKRVIEDKSFKNNMLRLRSLMRENPMPPLDLAVWWVEHILQYGGEHLRSAAFGLSWTEYYEVALVLTVSAICISVLVILIFMLLFVIRLLKKFMVGKNIFSKSKTKVS